MLKSTVTHFFIALVAGILGIGSAMAGDDAPLFAAYDQVNSADIEIAEMGAIKGTTPELRAIAAMVLRDHSMVRQMGRDIADRNGIAYVVPADDNAAKAHRAALARLQRLKGPAFDEAYLRHEAAFHRAAIEAVRTVLIPSAGTAAFREHLTAVLPAFEHHLAATLEAAEALGYDTGN